MSEETQKYQDPDQDRALAMRIAGGSIEIAKAVLGILLFWRWRAAQNGETSGRVILPDRRPDNPHNPV